MTGRRGGAATVLSSLENPEANRCVDLFVRPDGTYGFEEYRRDPEDGGRWTPVTSFAGIVFATAEEAIAAARKRVPWLANG
ncbi:hypothetical protein STVA_17820 [Allostella vacuolata]|nr:hypothetical protein STVA_17820 [Stella vacuolata]